MFCTLFLRIAVAFLHVTGKKCQKVIVGTLIMILEP
jgi:hypothetical protein